MRLHDLATIEEYTKSGHWKGETILDLFSSQVSNFPHKLAIQDPLDKKDLVGIDPQSLTWSQLDQVVDSLALALIKLGLNQDEIILVQLPNIWELIALYLAISKAGGIISPLPMQWQNQEISTVLKSTQAKLFIGTTNFKGNSYLNFDCLKNITKVSLDELKVLINENNEIEKNQFLDLEKRASKVDSNDIFSICWTSGTEAESKGCPYSHNNWLYQSGNLVKILELTSDARLLATPPIVNMTGVGVIFVPWILTGGTLLLHHPLNLDLLLSQLSSQEPNFTILVPTLLNKIIQDSDTEDLDLSSLSTIATGSAPPPVSTIEYFKKRWNIDIINIWGQNEGPSLIAGTQDVTSRKDRSSCFPWWGNPSYDWPSGVTGIKTKIKFDSKYHPISNSIVGELCYKGPNLFPGYFNNEQLNKKFFDSEGYFSTGDIFAVQKEKYLVFFDRKKDIIIRGGFNISAAEIENLALMNPKISEAAAVGINDEIMGEILALFVVLKPNVQSTDQQIIDFFTKLDIAKYKIPEIVKIIDSFERNALGKINKTKLRSSISK